MSFRFDKDEHAHDALRRLAREQLDDAVRVPSEGYRDDPVEAVHAARKAVKKERALLRLARGAMPGEQRARENAALRDAARALSDTRDRAVVIEAFDQLADRFVGQVPEQTFAAVREGLEQASQGDRGHDATTTQARAAARELAAIGARVDTWEIRPGGWRTVGEGLGRTYRRGRTALRHARTERSDESVHAARKRVKDLWYELRVLAEACGPAVGGQAKEAHGVADLLGDDHDLAVLRGAIQSISPSVAVDVEPLLGLVDYRRDELQSDAITAVSASTPSGRRRLTGGSVDTGERGVPKVDAVRERRPAELAERTRSPVGA